ncbi:nucleoside-diphosphate sugar epimerase/dehydratase [Cohnella fermenti]|uniref:C-methyltransferase domain-containing protein n=1 Tax=Cohnella fermenti TaxID=2565925 RepID=A0A4S4BZR6_9BACL|nr:hypothetical protein [Cohnella fermenti]THF80797.1 hypothetical protein E6C55_09950 [Cohnella fermenti]
MVLFKINNTDFVSRFSLDTVIMQDGWINYEGELERVSSVSLSSAISFLQCDSIKFSLRLNNEDVLIEKKDKECYFVLNVLLVESLYELFYGSTIEDELFEESYSKKIQELFLLWNEFSVKIKDKLIQYFEDHIIEFTQYTTRFERINRNKVNLELSSALLEFIENKKKFPSKLNEFSRIAIYGAGKLGVITYHLLKKQGINVVNFIDNFAKSKAIESTPIYTLDDFPVGNVDFIIVTPIYDFDKISSAIAERNSIETISLSDLVS